MTTPTERANQMIWCLARQARPDDVMVVGVATPIATAAALVARELVTPEATVIVAASVDPPAHDIAQPMLRADAVAEISAGTYPQTGILDAIQAGRVSMQFISPAQVDGRGRLNTSRVPARDGGIRRLPGGLATGDIAVLVGRLVAYRADHSPRFLADEVTFTTGAGHEHGPHWRARHGLPGQGVRSIVTDRAVLVWDDAQDGFQVSSVHGGSSIDEVIEGCGFPLTVENDPHVTPEPPEEMRQLLDEVIDPHGVRTLELGDGREEALQVLEALRH